jgi:hypothetical protein
VYSRDAQTPAGYTPELIENDPRNMAAAREGAAAAGLDGITVTCADAGDFAAYRTATPADLVLLAGVPGNISDQDVRATITVLPRLCAPEATVIWTCTRRAADLTSTARRWFGQRGLCRAGLPRATGRGVLRRRAPAPRPTRQPTPERGGIQGSGKVAICPD